MFVRAVSQGPSNHEDAEEMYANDPELCVVIPGHGNFKYRWDFRNRDQQIINQ